MFLGFLLGVSSLAWIVDNKEFIETANSQIADGYEWNIMGCRAPDTSVPYIAITGPTGKEFVCNKLKK
tara:strand:+ start:171 stop:374 length:204 start_codon:yes stop_codon:yes gene_type:complete